MTFLEKLKINKNQLSAEWEKYSSEYFRVAEKHARILLSRDRLKDQIDVTKSEIYSNIKTDPKSFGTDKPTESFITALIAKTDIVVELTKQLQEKQYNLALAKAAVVAFEHKKTALACLTDIHLASCYAQSTYMPDKSRTNNTVVPIRRKK